MKRKLEVVIEEAKDGQLWGRINYGDDLLTTNAESEELLIDNFKDQLEAFYQVKTDSLKFEIRYDVEAVFSSIEDISITGIAKRAKMNESLLRQYSIGKKNPSADQVQRIESAIHDLASRLQSVRLYYGVKAKVKDSGRARKSGNIQIATSSRVSKKR